MKIAMIGGSGFVGTRLIGLLGEEPQKYQCSNIDLLPSHFFNDITTIGDVRDQQQMDSLLKGATPWCCSRRNTATTCRRRRSTTTTNVGGMEVTLRAMERNGISSIIFFSSVAVYGLNKKNPDENHPADPFNHYGKSKWQAEEVLRKWYETHPDWNIDIVRPTVISASATVATSTICSAKSHRASSSWWARVKTASRWPMWATSWHS